MEFPKVFEKLGITEQDILDTLNEFKIKKIVNRKGQITKRKTAGKKGKKVVGGKIKTQSSAEKKNKRLGNIKRRKTLKRKSVTLKKRSSKFAALGRKKRKQKNLHDYRG